MKALVQRLNWSDFVPKSVQCLKNYSLGIFMSDMSAAIVVALAGLPLAIGYALAVGLPPHIGIYCTIAAGFITALLGGSRYQISGPTAGFEACIIAVLATHGANGLFTTVVISGIMLIALGLTGLGLIVNYIPRPIVLGIANGIGVYLVVCQFQSVLGLAIPNWRTLNTLGKLQATVTSIGTISWPTAIIGVTSIIALFSLQKYVKKIPGPLLVTLLGSLAVLVFGIDVSTIGTKFAKGIPQGFFIDSIPTFQLGAIFNGNNPLIHTAFTIAMLVSLKALVSATIADRMTHDKHNPNMELIGQGMGNIASAFVGGMPSTGAIARSANNVRCGGKTPVAGMMVSVVLLSVLLFAAPAAKHIPLCILAAIMFVVGYNMGEWSAIPKILKLTKADIAVWLLTFVLTASGEVDSAIKFGFVLAAALYIQKVSTTTSVGEYRDGYIEDETEKNPVSKKVFKGAAIFNIQGPFLFGATHKLSQISDKIPKLPPIIILRLKGMTAIDATGIQAFELLAKKVTETNRHLILCGLTGQPEKLLNKANFNTLIGESNCCDTMSAALSRAQQIASSDMEYAMAEKTSGSLQYSKN